MSSVVLERVSKVFPRPGGTRVQALKDFSLEVAEREFMVLLGPSGSGKTTVLRLIAGLEEATSGSIRIGGVPMDRVPPQARDVAMVFQHHALYPHKTVRENCAFGLKLRKVPRAEIETRVQEMAALLELAPVLDALPAQLSGGQRQRVALGRALIRRPKVLLCDEPLSQLDAPLRVQLRAELLRLRERFAVTVLYVTHDQVEAMTLGDRVAVIHEGVLRQVAAPMSVYQEPADLVVAGFVGLPPMNLVHGTLLERDGALWFQEKTEARARGLTLRVETQRTGRLQALAGNPIVLGLRAEHIAMDREPTQGIEATIRQVERAGADVWLTCDTGAHRLVVRVTGMLPVRAGERIRLSCDQAKARYFDPVTQRSVG